MCFLHIGMVNIVVVLVGSMGGPFVVRARLTAANVPVVSFVVVPALVLVLVVAPVAVP